MKIVFEYDEGDDESFWAAVSAAQEWAREASEERHVQTYLSHPTPLEWWIALLDDLGLPKTAGQTTCGKAIRNEGFKMPAVILRKIIRARKGL